jgi:phage terminase large subunit
LQTYAVFDLGFNDSMTCGLTQRTNVDIRIMDYIENNRVALSWFDEELRVKNFDPTNTIIVFPHDGRHKNLQTALSPQEVMQMYGWQVEIVDNVGVENGIRITRELMSQMYIDEFRCSQLLERLKRYARNKHGHPLHDENSHGADMTRYIGVHANRMTTGIIGAQQQGWGRPLNYPQLYTG